MGIYILLILYSMLIIIIVLTVVICSIEQFCPYFGKSLMKIVKFSDGTYAVRKPSLLNWNGEYADSDGYIHRSWWPLRYTKFAKVKTLEEAKELLHLIKNPPKKDRGITVDTE